MATRIALVLAALALAAFAMWHRASGPAVESALSSLPAATSWPDAGRRQRGFVGTRHRTGADPTVIVYVVGAVRRPGLYQLHDGDRYARAVALAGGFSAPADRSGVNLAQRAADGDEVEVPAAGARPRSSLAGHHSRRRSLRPPSQSVDLNAADAAQLAAVPGIGRAVAARIVELRQREGAFASLDELLDVAGMTQARLERARPYLRAL